MIAAALKHYNAFISGDLDSLFTHIVLLVGSIAAEFAVAAGIILESPKEKAWRERLGMGLVLGGVLVSAIFTVSLFVLDEGVSGGHQWEIGQLRVRAAQLSNEAAKAIERAKTLEMQAAKLQQDNLGLQDRIADAAERAAAAEARGAEIERAAAWRQFTPDQKRQMIQVLSRAPADVQVAWVANDPESLFFAGQVIELFKQAHWSVWASAKTWSNVLLFIPIVPPTGDAAATATVKDALSAAAIRFSSTPLPQPTSETDEGMPPPSAAVLFVGSQEPPFVKKPE